MKYREELKIGTSAVLFCVAMLLVYMFFPKDGIIPIQKVVIPEIPSVSSGSDEGDYGFQIYTEANNYDDSYNYEESYPTEDLYDTEDSYDYNDDTEYTYEEDDTSDTDWEDSDWQEPDYGDEDTIDIGNSEDDYMPGESEGEDTDTGEYESDIGSDEIEWNETEETFQFE